MYKYIYNGVKRGGGGGRLKKWGREVDEIRVEGGIENETDDSDGGRE